LAEQSHAIPHRGNQAIASHPDTENAPCCQSDEFEAVLEKKAMQSGRAIGGGSNQKARQSRVDPTERVHRGWLQKQGEGFASFMRWKTRYFILYANGNLRYYENESGKNVLGEINAQDVTNVVSKAGTTDFDVITPRRTFHLKADSDKQRADWVGALQRSGVSREVCIQDIDLVQMLGEGAQAKVVQVTDKGTGDQMAMKVYPLAKLMDGAKAERVAVERKLLAELDHPYIIKGQSAFKEGDQLYICMEFASGGDLWGHMYQNDKCPLYKGKSASSSLLAGFYLAEVVSALGCLHSKNVLYADLKPENLVIGTEGHLKVTDFGLCRLNVQSYTGRDAFPCFQSKDEPIGGTPEYYAPELIHTRQRGPLGKALDWWTLGVLAFELFQKVTPFKIQKTSFDINEQAILDGRWVMDWTEYPGMPFTARSFIKALLEPNAARRLGTQGTVEIMKHPFFDEVGYNNWSGLEMKEISPPWRPAQDSSPFAEAGAVPASVMKPNAYKEGQRLSEINPELKGFAFNRRDTKTGSQGSGGASASNVTLPPMPEGNDNLGTGTWQKASGRRGGPKGYQFGDISRSIGGAIFGRK